MFSHTFLSHTLSGAEGNGHQEHQMLPILSVPRLLADAHNQERLKRIKHLLALPEEHYERFYLSLIESFAAFAQVLPVTQGASLGSLLAIGLERGLIALESSRKRQQCNDLWVYALFSSALLWNVGIVGVDRRVMISNKEGAFVQEWLPHGKPMTECGAYFKLRYRYYPTEVLASQLTPIYAQLLMPSLGFSWMAEDLEILSQWLSALLRTDTRRGGLAARLRRSEEILTERLKEKPHAFAMTVETLEAKETQAGEAFWKWLRLELLYGHLTINDEDAEVYHVNEGLLLDDARLFAEFGRVYPQYSDWIAVYQQFNMLGLTKLSGDDVRFEQYFSKHPNSPLHDSQTFALFHQHPEVSAKKLSHTLSVHDKFGVVLAGSVIRDPSLLFDLNKMPKVDPKVKARQVESSMKRYLDHLQRHQERLGSRLFHTMLPKDHPWV